ncbi:MAG: ATP F0F1 synthase subunit B, partial [Xanthobacteraceae bacterium]
MHLLADPETWVAIAFVILMGLFAYLGVHRMLLKALDNRSERIRGELDEAKRLKE